MEKSVFKYNNIILISAILFLFVSLSFIYNYYIDSQLISLIIALVLFIISIASVYLNYILKRLFKINIKKIDELYGLRLLEDEIKDNSTIKLSGKRYLTKNFVISCNFYRIFAFKYENIIEAKRTFYTKINSKTNKELHYEEILLTNNDGNISKMNFLLDNNQSISAFDIILEKLHSIKEQTIINGVIKYYDDLFLTDNYLIVYNKDRVLKIRYSDIFWIYTSKFENYLSLNIKSKNFVNHEYSNPLLDTNTSDEIIAKIKNNSSNILVGNSDTNNDLYLEKYNQYKVNLRKKSSIN